LFLLAGGNTVVVNPHPNAKKYQRSRASHSQAVVAWRFSGENCSLYQKSVFRVRENPCFNHPRFPCCVSRAVRAW
jgi:hypothetical protein